MGHFWGGAGKIIGFSWNMILCSEERIFKNYQNRLKQRFKAGSLEFAYIMMKFWKWKKWKVSHWNLQIIKELSHNLRRNWEETGVDGEKLRLLGIRKYEEILISELSELSIFFLKDALNEIIFSVRKRETLKTTKTE